MYIFLCEDTADGIFTAIYRAWESKYGHDNIRLQVEGNMNYELFAEYIRIETDDVRASKVANTLNKKFGEEGYMSLLKAAYSDDLNKADVIYRTVIFGLSLKNGKELMNYFTHEAVNTVFTLSRNVSSETHHFLGFIRFQQLKSGILFSKIHPRNNVLAFIAPHFANRLPNENWLIYDENRTEALIHKKQYAPVIVSAKTLDLRQMNDITDEEKEYQKLWKAFCESITIKERVNPNLQRQNLPLRFRKNITEFQ